MKRKIISFSLILCLLIGIVPTVSATGVVNIMINGTYVEFTEATGYPFTDENGRTQVPFRATMEAFGATVDWDSEKQLAYATYNGIKVYAPIGGKYIIVNDEQIENDTSAILKDGRTYCPIRKVLEAFGCTVEWNPETNSVIVTSDNTGIPHPILEGLYTVTEGTGKYSGYKVLHGHPQQDKYIIYFKYLEDGDNSSVHIQCDLVNEQDLAETISWSYKGNTYANTRGELYEFFSDSITLSSYLDIDSGTLSQDWLKDNFGQVYYDWLDSIYTTQYSQDHVEAYLEGILMPNPINFNINYDDWVKLSDLEEEYNLRLEQYGQWSGNEHPFLEYTNWDYGIYRYELPGYYSFLDGFLEFNNIRMINLDGTTYAYRNDIEGYVISWIDEQLSPIINFNETWLTIDELEDDYGVCFSALDWGKEEIGFYQFLNSDEIFYLVEDYDKNFSGEQTFSNIRMIKEEDGNILINKENFEEFVVTKLNEVIKEKEEFYNTWISEYHLDSYGVEFTIWFISDDTMDYCLNANDEYHFLTGLKEYKKEHDEEDFVKEFNGVEVYYKDGIFLINKECLREIGFIE